MATVHLFCGLPASGKTRLARELAQTHDAVRLTLDEWMLALTDWSIFDDEYGRFANRLKEQLWETAVRLLELDVDVVLDWSLWNPERRRKWVERATAVGADHRLYYLNIPHAVLRERLQTRSDDLPPQAHSIPLEELERFLPFFQPPTEAEAVNVVEMVHGYDQPIHNPHLPGDPFFMEGGRDGVLLMHGLTATTAEVRLLAERLHAAGYTVSAPLLPGHGTRPDELNAVTWHDWAWEAEKAYQHLATVCDRVFVGGESTGAVLALHLATRHPEIAGVLCYAPAIRLAMGMHQLARLYVAAPLVDAIPKPTMGSNPYWQGYRVYPLRGVMELVRLGRDVRGRLAQVTAPVLVMQGRNDTTIDPESGQIILDSVASEVTALHWLPQSGHIILLEEELDEIETVTRAFLES